MIKAKDILQIDATVLAGILILLTLIFSGNANTLDELAKDDSERTIYSEFTNTPVAWIYGIGVFFAISAIFAILSSIREKDTYDSVKEHSSDLFTATHFISLGAMFSGFVVFTYAFFQLGIVLINLK